MKNWIGRFIQFIGILHLSVGFILLGRIGLELLQDGLFNTVNGQPMREAFFWFIFTGFLIIIIGQIVHWLERNQEAIPTSLGWSLLTLSTLGVFIMPASGIWLMFVPAIGILKPLFVKTRALN